MSEKKKNTREKILKAAIKLFNSEGVSGVTTRSIAAETGISHGNLTYHFPGKKDVILAIYENMYASITDEDENLLFSREDLPYPDGRESIADLHNMFLFILEFQNRYLFIYAEMLEVTRLVPEIKDGITANYQDRIDTFREILRNIQKKGRIKKSVGEETILGLAKSIVFINTLWLSQSKVYTNADIVSARSTLEMLWGIIRPHLSEKGEREFQELRLTP